MRIELSVTVTMAPPSRAASTFGQIRSISVASALAFNRSFLTLMTEGAESPLSASKE